MMPPPAPRRRPSTAKIALMACGVIAAVSGAMLFAFCGATAWLIGKSQEGSVSGVVRCPSPVRAPLSGKPVCGYELVVTYRYAGETGRSATDRYHHVRRYAPGMTFTVEGRELRVERDERLTAPSLGPEQTGERDHFFWRVDDASALPSGLRGLDAHLDAHLDVVTGRSKTVTSSGSERGLASFRIQETGHATGAEVTLRGEVRKDVFALRGDGG
jgi:hypothetical protein